MFEQSFLPRPGRTRRTWSIVVSAAGQVAIAGIAVLLPLVFSEQLPRAQLAAFRSRIFPPPGRPPGPPPGHVKVVDVVRYASPRPRLLLAPARIPDHVAMLVEPAPSLGPATGGPYVPGAIGGPEGVPGGLPGLPAGFAPQPAPPPPPAAPGPAAPAPPKILRIRVGGGVQEARLIRKVLPVYPPLALQARISGTVRLEAIIGGDGRIRQLRAISGPALLVQSALDAVAQWIYAPTLLNGDPVEVWTTIEVHFKLAR